MLERPWVRTLITWAVALAVYLGVRFVEAFDIHRMLPRDDHALEARADQLAAHVTGTVGRARDLERARVAGLCQALAHEPDAARLPHLVSSAVSQSNLAELTVLVPDATGDAPVAYDYVPGRGAARSIHWNDALAEALPAAPAPGRTSGIDDDLAAIIPASGLASSAGLGVIRMGCRATSSGGRAHVVVAYLDVLTVAELALPETVASVSLETESSRSPGLRRWLGPADGDAPRPALRVPVGAAPIRASTAFAPLIAAIVSALGVFFALRPKKSSGAVLGTLEAAAERVGRGDLEVMLAAEGGAADGTFTAFNRMTRDLKDARARLVRAERVAAWRDVARRIAHEIKNPPHPPSGWRSRRSARPSSGSTPIWTTSSRSPRSRCSKRWAGWSASSRSSAASRACPGPRPRRSISPRSPSTWCRCTRCPPRSPSPRARPRPR
jgi:hypothetical protein